MAFAVYGMAVVVAPAIGPTLGGWITDNYDWRWIFFINIPVVILSLFLTYRLVEDPPYLKEVRKKAAGIKPDFMGLGLITIAVGCLQLVLDKGQEADWFATWWINLALFTAAATLIVWVFWEWRHPFPIVNVRLFRNRNFAVAMFFTFMLGTVLFGTTVVIPQFLQTLLGYPAEIAGEALAGGGIAMLLMMPISGFLVSRMDPRLMMACGFAGTAASLYWMTTHISLQLDFQTAFMMRTLQAISLPFIFLPSNTLAYVGIPREQNNQVSGMNAFVRNIGGSIGIAMITTVLIRQGQKHTTYLTANAVPGNSSFDNLVGGISGSLQKSGVTASLATQQAYARVYQMILGQATALAYIDVLSYLAVIVACLIPFVLLMRRGNPVKAPATH
jgi:DHA2 family multidrug resistance protein